MKINLSRSLTLILTCLLCGHNTSVALDWSNQNYYYSGAIGCLAGGIATYALKDTISEWIKTYSAPRVATLTFEGSICHAGSLINALIDLKHNDCIDGVLLIINSGGGRAGQSEILHRTIKSLTEEKPVIIFVIDCCASGAYFAASAASKIIAPRLSALGSIGVYSTIVKAYPEKFDDKETSGTLDVYEFVAGKYKQSAAPYQQLDEDNKQHQQEHIEQLYDSFCVLVADARNLRLDEANIWAEGQVFGGKKAEEIGLIDKVGGVEDAIEMLKLELKKRGKKPDSIKLVDYGAFYCPCS